MIKIHIDQEKGQREIEFDGHVTVIIAELLGAIGAAFYFILDKQDNRKDAAFFAAYMQHQLGSKGHWENLIKAGRKETSP